MHPTLEVAAGDLPAAAAWAATVEAAAGNAWVGAKPLPARQLLSRREVAARYGVDVQTITRWVDAGVFPQPLRILATLRWSIAELDTFDNTLRAAKNRPMKKAD